MTPYGHVTVQNYLWKSASLAITPKAQSILGSQGTENGYDYCSRAKKITTL